MSEARLEQPLLPVGAAGTLTNGYWGMVGVVLTEGTMFVLLDFSYYYWAVQPHLGSWPPDGAPSLRYSLPGIIVMLVSAAAIWFAERGARRGSRPAQLAGLLLTLALGLAFVALQSLEWHSKNFTLSSGPYGSLYFVITGIHLAHAVVGLLALAAVIAWASLGYFGPGREAYVTIVALYWYFVVATLVTVFFTFDLTPRLGLIWHAGQIS